MLRIADAYNEEIEKAIRPLELENQSPTQKFETFKTIAYEIMCTGIHWGKIAIMFVFGGKVLSAGYDFAKQIFDFILSFVKDRLLGWILKSGGWVSNYFHLNYIINAQPTIHFWQENL